VRRENRSRCASASNATGQYAMRGTDGDGEVFNGTTISTFTAPDPSAKAELGAVAASRRWAQTQLNDKSGAAVQRWRRRTRRHLGPLCAPGYGTRLAAASR
jgi:hypothetical protein